jgi:anti-sigma regulatory factor (Ser/Thr protein kinase)
MSTHNTLVTIGSIKSDIKKTDSAIREAVANAIDADGKNIYIQLSKEHDTGSIAGNVFDYYSLDIADDGTGIPVEDTKFEEVFCQYRVSTKNEKTNYGRRGKGRYTYLTATNSPENATIFTKSKQKWFQIKFNASEKQTIQILKSDFDGKIETGISKTFNTLVQLKNLDTHRFLLSDVSLENLLTEIKSEIVSFFADRIASKSIKIYVNNELLKISDYLEVPIRNEKFIVNFDDLSANFVADFYIWNDHIHLKADRQKHILFMDDNDTLKGIAPSGKHKLSIANKKQNHTIIVKSSYLNDLDFINDEDFHDNLFTNKIIENLRKQLAMKLEEILFVIYKKHLDEISDEYIKFLNVNLDDEKMQNVYHAILFPIIEKLGNRKVHDDIKSLIAHLVDVLLKVSPDSYITNLQTVLKLSKEDSYKIEYIEKNYGIIKAISEKQKYIERIDTLNKFDEMVNGTSRAKIKERTMLHHVIDKNLWIIDEVFEGVEFSDIASDVSLKSILENNQFYSFDNKQLNDLVKELNLKKVPDIFIPIEKDKTIFIVELKKPRAKITQQIISEIMEKYTNVFESINSRLPEIDRKKIFAIAISDDKTGTVYTVGDLDKNGVQVEPRTWKEVIDKTRARYGDLISDLDQKLKSSRWTSLEDFINGWNAHE